MKTYICLSIGSRYILYLQSIILFLKTTFGGFIINSDSHGHNFSFIVEHIMEAEPFTRRGKKAFDNLGISTVSESEFLSNEGLYVPPFTGLTDRIDKKDSSNKGDYNTYSATEARKFLENEELDFRNKLKALGASFFMIKGVAGCGKTTYMQKLKSDVEQESTL